MEIHQLRGWAEFTDKATVIALAVAAIALVAAGASTWLSFTYNRALREQESLALERAGGRSAEVEKEVAALRERSSRLERTLADVSDGATEARKHIERIEEAIAAATIRTTDLEKEVAAARAAGEKPKDAATAPPEPQAQPQTASPPPAAEKPAETKPAEAKPAEKPVETPVAKPDDRYRQLVTDLRRFSGTKVAIYVVAGVPDAAEAGAALESVLSEADWAATRWDWTGVNGIAGVVVLTKVGVDLALDQAALATADMLHAAGFNAVKANWPADADWRRFQGKLSGPQSPDPTDARIRIVIGARPKL